MMKKNKTKTEKILKDAPRHLPVTSFAALAGQLHLTPPVSYVAVFARHPDLPERVLGELPRGSLQHELFVV